MLLYKCLAFAGMRGSITGNIVDTAQLLDEQSAHKMLGILEYYGWDDAQTIGLAKASSLAESLRVVLQLPTLQTITVQLSFTERLSAKPRASVGTQGHQASGMGADMGLAAPTEPAVDRDRDLWGPNSRRFRGVIIWQLVISFIVVSLGLPTVGIILLSQFATGMLLPMVTYCLLKVMNSCVP